MAEAEVRAVTRCEQCGQSDDHPKANFSGGRVVHHDCMSSAEEDLARSAGVGPIVDSCKDGLRGDRLLGFIRDTEGGTL